MGKNISINWRELAQSMDGMSGSEVVHIAQNAAKYSVLEGHNQVSEADVRHALAEVHERLQSH